MDIKISKASGNDVTLVVTPQAKQTITIDRNIKGTDGTNGTNGTNGVGVPVGGSTGQVLSKINATDYNTTWTTPTTGTVTQVAATAGTGISVSGSPITSSGSLTITNTAPDQTVSLTGAGTTTVTGTYPNFTITSTGSTGTVTSVTGTAPIVSSGGTTPAISITSSGANSAVLRDSNLNISANSISEGYLNVAAAGTTTTLTAASAPNYVVTGSGGQTFQLPNATLIPNGINYQFNNNQTSGTIVVKNNSGTTIATVQSGGFVDITLLSNSNNTSAAGSWDVHNIAPSNVSWSTNTFDYAGSITSATWNGATVQVNRGGTGATTLTGYVKGAGTTAMTATALIPIADINATGTPSSTTYLRGDGTWSTVSGGSMVYPSSAGIAYYDGTIWGTSYGVTGTGSVALNNNPVFATNITVNSIPMGAGVANITNNLGLGINALSNASTTGADNVAIGTGTLPIVTTGYQNTAIGSGALSGITTGVGNVGIGYQAGASITSASGNLIIGQSSGGGITTQNNNMLLGGSVFPSSACTRAIGVGNSIATASAGTVTDTTFIGYNSGSGSLTSLLSSVVIGHNTISSATSVDSVVFVGRGVGSSTSIVGAGSVGIGYFAIQQARKITTAVGYQAAYSANNRGDSCTAIGYQALYTNGGSAIASTTISANNTALGHKALYANTTGAGNTAIGMQAGWGAAGTNANTTGSNNTYIGNQTIGSASTNSNETVIGAGITGNGSSSTTVGGTLYSTNYTVGTLPTSTVGARSFVTDALAPAFGSTVVGGGSVPVPVYYDGTNWKVG